MKHDMYCIVYMYVSSSDGFILIYIYLAINTCLRAFCACPLMATASNDVLIVLSGTWSSDSLRNFFTGFLAAGKTRDNKKTEKLTLLQVCIITMIN